MKVLLREFDNEQYVWKNAEIDSDTSFIVDGKRVFQTNVVSVFRDNRTNFVKCSMCGAILKNVPEVIAEHRKKATTSETCLNCKYLRERRPKQKSIKYVAQPDGTYLVTDKREARLMCTHTWRSYDINSAEARSNCRYGGCVRANMVEFKDIFIKYPQIFDDIITVDRIIDKGFKERTVNSNGYTFYSLKSTYKITAAVNKRNIVDHFVISYYSREWSVVYSKKYDMFFVCSGGEYRNLESRCDIPEKTLDGIKKEIASLYA